MYGQLWEGNCMVLPHLRLLSCRQGQQKEQEAMRVMCRMEEAKLLWAQGQQSMAMRVAWALLGSSGSAKSSVPVEGLQRSRLQSLLGKWLSLNRCPIMWRAKHIRMHN